MLWHIFAEQAIGIVNLSLAAAMTDRRRELRPTAAAPIIADYPAAR